MQPECFVGGDCWANPSGPPNSQDGGFKVYFCDMELRTLDLKNTVIIEGHVPSMSLAKCYLCLFAEPFEGPRYDLHLAVEARRAFTPCHRYRLGKSLLVLDFNWSRSHMPPALHGFHIAYFCKSNPFRHHTASIGTAASHTLIRRQLNRALGAVDVL